MQYHRIFIQKTFTEPFSENKGLQEPQTIINAQLTTQNYYKIPKIELNKILTVYFKTLHDTSRNHDTIIPVIIVIIF